MHEYRKVGDRYELKKERKGAIAEISDKIFQLYSGQ